jgi:hypothetical protein
MSYDLALNRLDHDLVFHEVDVVKAKPIGPQPLNYSQVTKYSIWPINDADKVAQQIKINLLSFLGEWFLDVTYGVPYLEEILVKNPRMASVETILRSHISSVPDVIRIDHLGLSWDRQKRYLFVEFACTTNLGPIKESVKLEIFRRE